MYKNVWNTQSKSCHEFQVPISIHLQICFVIMNGAKCPINIKSIASLNMGMPFLPSQTTTLSRKTCKNWFISTKPWFNQTKPDPYWYNLQGTFEAQFLLPRSSNTWTTFCSMLPCAKCFKSAIYPVEILQISKPFSVKPAAGIYQWRYCEIFVSVFMQSL